VRKLGGGTTIFTGNNSYTGGTTNASGILQLGNGGTTGSIVGDIINGGSLVFDRSNTVSFAGTITGAGGVRQAGAGTTILTAGNAYTGTTAVDAGTLLINGNQSAATGLTSVASGATLGGTGMIGGTVAVAGGGTLAPGSNGAGTLHIGGNLTLAATSLLNFQFGQAGTAGGALNDLLDVAGDLTLDGTISVSATPAGSFGAGLYRIANYGGTLIDNGLSVGTLPSGFDASVQTSVAQQVNLIATASAPPGGGAGGPTGGLSFWDGAAGPKGNNAIDGGDGLWQNGTGNDNWTSSTGAVNARYADGTLAIFATAPGTVTVDDSLGAVTASGLQFAVNGYRLTGGALTLTGTQAAIRVGDGTAAGAGYSATVSAVLSGSAQLAKTDLGTLVLTGANSYSGGTLVQSGTLLVNGDASAATGATSVVSGATLGGAGTIGGNVAFADDAILAPGSKAPGTLTIKGNLSLGAGTLLAYQLGQANAVGGALNDLVNVGGNLVLDGTLNVSVPAGGAFGVGVYRLFNYGGALTDNGLTLGTLPATGVTVQTSVAGQVNLINGAGLALNFWDGGSAPRGDNVVSGGSGTWQNHSGNDNWTDATGAINGAYTDGAFAIFGGTGGTVTVDTSLGAVTSGGMQFAANGYTVGGGTITLAGPQSIIRVGDGTTAGAQFSAAIGATLGGTAQLVKTDLGTLILGGTNSYTGGTLINAGTLQIASDGNLGAAAGGVTLDGGTLATSADLTSARNVLLAGAGAVSTASGTTFMLSGALSGSGALTKVGAGTLRLTGDNSAYAGATAVSGGTLDVRGAIGGTMTVATAARLEGTGRIGSLTNAGTIAPGGADLGMLTVAGNYAGNGGTLEVAAQLGGDASLADRLVVNGGTSGTTQVTVINRGGLGAQTAEGIKVVDVAGASDGIFALRGDYVFQGDQAVIAGAYGYRLYKGGVTTPSDGDWYLRSTLLNPVSPPQTPDTPLYQPGVPVYEVYPSTLLLLNGIDTMQQRTGDRGYSTSSDGRSNGIWGRTEGQRFRPNAVLTTSGADADYNSWKAEIGADHVLVQTARGATLTGSISARYGKASARVNSLFGNGSVKTHGYGGRATLTWQDQAGFYADVQAQFSWYDSDLNSSVLGKLIRGNDGRGQAYSIELGKRVALGGIAITPQLQTVYSRVRFDSFTDPAGAAISLDKADSFKTRWGIAIEHRSGLSRIYAVGNLTYDWLGDTVTDVSGTPIARTDYRLWSEASVGGSIGVNDSLSLYGEVSGKTAVRDFGKSYGLKGVVGVRMRF
jgi:fibronectin-binding autotransporter adhesin